MKRVLFLLNNNIEDGEALMTRALLVRANMKVDTFSLSTKNLTTYYKQKIEADLLADEIEIDKYDLLVLPGGKHVFEVIGNEKLNEIIMYFYNHDKHIAAICAAPMFLGKLGLLKNRFFTSFPSTEEGIDGNYLKNEKVVVDGKIITGRSVSAVVDFSHEIIKQLLGKEEANKFKENIIY